MEIELCGMDTTRVRIFRIIRETRRRVGTGSIRDDGATRVL